MTLKIDITEDGARLVVTMAGPIDVTSAPGAWERLQGATAGDLVLDLSGVEFIDSSGINLLVRLRRGTVAGGRGLLLREPSRCVTEVLAAVGLAQAFPREAAGSA